MVFENRRLCRAPPSVRAVLLGTWDQFFAHRRWSDHKCAYTWKSSGKITHFRKARVAFEVTTRPVSDVGALGDSESAG